MNSKERLDLIESFMEFKKNETQAFAMAAMNALLEFARRDDSTTMQEFIARMGEARKVLQSSSHHVSVRSGCELFVRFITFSHSALEQATDFKSCREILLQRGQSFIDKMKLSRFNIIEFSKDLIVDGMKILTHARSRNVLAVMEKAVERGTKFKVFITESQPTCDGRRMSEDLKALGIPSTVILDASVAFNIEKMDAVIFGAEGVCKDGGIINRIGTCNIAMLAHFKKKPVYVISECFKFVQLMPHNNKSIPKEFVYPVEVVASGRNLEDEQPLVDYTEPKFLTALYTDMGVMHPYEVVERLIHLYT